MGIYDRDYLREEEPRGPLAGWSMVTNLLVINSVIFIVDALFLRREQMVNGRMEVTHLLSDLLALKANLPHVPWNFWQLVTYGFVHDPEDFKHILFNMFSLWMFGREIENIYGSKEFLRLYLTMIVMGGLVWVVSENIIGPVDPAHPPQLIGASGAVVGMIIVWTCHFPMRLIYIWGVLPLRGWIYATLFIAAEVFGATNHASRTAHSVHLAGAAFGFIYYRSGWNLGRLMPRRWSLSSLKLRPKLRIHDPEFDERDLSRQVDKILEKISREGESSLTRQERKTLEEASRRYQRKRQ